MATLPQGVDFGARPSLRSNRIDVPGQGGLEVAAALKQAADTFVAMSKENEAKEDRLNYSLAKNELLALDLAERQKLVNDEDWETFDERYSTGYNAGRDTIYANRPQKRRDQALLDAESNLIRERGRVQVGASSREVMRDNQQAFIEANLEEAREQVQNADPVTANDIMLTQLENIKAAEEVGIYSDIEALAKSQKFVQDTAHARLVSMDVEDRITELEQSLKYRKTHGGPITVEDIEAGKGTGSIADFLNTDTATKMLRAAENENDIDSALSTAFEAVDAGWFVHPEFENSKEREALINKALKDDPAARKEALILERQRTADEARGESAVRGEAIDRWSADITTGTSTFSDIPANEREIIGPAGVELLQRLAENQPEREGYGEFTDDVTYYKWRGMSDQQKVDANLMSAEWKPLLTRQDHQRFVDERDVISTRLANGKPPPSYKGDTDDEYLTNVLLGGDFGFDKRPTPGQPGYERWARVDKAYDDALKDESMQRIRDGKSGDLNADDRRTILNDTLKEQVFLRRDRFGPNILWRSKYEREGAFVVELTPEQVKDAFVPIDVITKDVWDVVGGRPIMADEFLRNLVTDDVSDKDVEEAYFYLKYHGIEAARNRLEGHKDY